MVNFFKKLFGKKNKIEKAVNAGDISEWSYQRFAKFYDIRVFPDPSFFDKINTIMKCVDNGTDRLDDIAIEANSNVEEVILMIRYLKNKRVFDDIFIDRYNKLVKKCTDEDKQILEKYYDMIYTEHLSIIEIAQKLPNYHNKPMPIIEEDVFKDIKFLYDRCIINGIKLDENRKEILYYTVEKHKKEEEYATVRCPKCGCLVDVLFNNSTICDYCGSNVEDTTNGKIKH